MILHFLLGIDTQLGQPITPDQLSLAMALTAAGATAFATFIVGLVAILKNIAWIGPRIDDGNEPTVVTLLAGIVVVLAVIDANITGLAGLFGAFVAWYGIVELAMAIHKRGSNITGAKRTTPPPADDEAPDAGALAVVIDREMYVRSTRQGAG